MFWNKSTTTLVPVSVELLIDRLRDRGWRLTSQRRVVAEVLSGPNVHLTADEVLERAQVRLPEISRATVYNTLTELVAMGEIAEVSTDERAKRYDPNPDRTHQHLVCDRCGRIVDVNPGPDAVAALPAVERHGFVLRQAEVTYRGICPECAGRAGA
jgi:Fur family transcriptional regulator, stress-responsive regulator